MPRALMSVSNGFLPNAFTMQRCDHMGNMNPKKVLSMVDNKRLPLLTTKAKTKDLGTKKIVEKDKKIHVTNAENNFLGFTGSLPPINDYHFTPRVYDYNPLSASKTLQEELAASTTFGEAAYIYPSSTTLDAAFTHTQCGLGQTGRLWVHQALGVEPDFMIVQFRGIGIGALVVNKRMNAHIHKYESNEHIEDKCSEKALDIFRNVRQPGYSAIITRKARYFEDILTKRLYGGNDVRAIRVFGLLASMGVGVDAQLLVDKCKECGLQIGVVGKGNIVRIIPPFNVNANEMDDAVDIMKECLRCEDDWERPTDYYPRY